MPFICDLQCIYTFYIYIFIIIMIIFQIACKLVSNARNCSCLLCIVLIVV